jgi:hypothetical protein
MLVFTTGALNKDPPAKGFYLRDCAIVDPPTKSFVVIDFFTDEEKTGPSYAYRGESNPEFRLLESCKS